MAWAEGDKEKIIFYLGYPTNQQSFDLIQAAMDRVDGLSAESVNLVQTSLTQIASLDTLINSSLDDTTQIPSLVSEARKYRDRVCQSLDLKVNRDVW